MTRTPSPATMALAGRAPIGRLQAIAMVDDPTGGLRDRSTTRTGR